MFEINVLLNQEHYLAFNEYHMAESAAGKKGLWSFRGLYCAICFAFVMFFYFTKSDMASFNQKSILVIIVAGLAIVFSKRIMLFSVRSNIKRISKNGKEPFSRETKLVFDEDNICEIMPSNETKTAYALVEQIILVNNAVYIYFGAAQAFIIPNEFFNNDEEKQQLLDLLKLKTNKSPINKQK